MKVKDVMNIVTQGATIVEEDSSIREVAKKLIEDPKTTTLYVVNKNKKLIGIVTIGTLLRYLYPEDIPPEYLEFDISIFQAKNLQAKDIMAPSIFIKKEESVGEAFRKMFEYKIWELPVVDDDMHVIGDINGLELIHAWLMKNNKS